jgi:hypothetical protein
MFLNKNEYYLSSTHKATQETGWGKGMEMLVAQHMPSLKVMAWITANL